MCTFCFLPLGLGGVRVRVRVGIESIIYLFLNLLVLFAQPPPLLFRFEEDGSKRRVTLAKLKVFTLLHCVANHHHILFYAACMYVLMIQVVLTFQSGIDDLTLEVEEKKMEISSGYIGLGLECHCNGAQ